MWKIALRGFRASFIRFILTLFSVILGSAFLTGTLALRDALESQFLSIAQTTQIYPLYVQGAQRATEAGAPVEGEARYRVPDSLAADLQSVPGVAQTMPEYMLVVSLYAADGTSLSAKSFAPTFVFGTHLQTLKYGETVVTGKIPAGGHQVMVERGAAERLDLEIGDHITLSYGDQKQGVDVVGIVDYGSTMAGATILEMDADAVADILREQTLAQALAATEEKLAANPPPGLSEQELAALREQSLAQVRKSMAAEPYPVRTIAIEVDDGANPDTVAAALNERIDSVWHNYDISAKPDVLTRAQTIEEINKDIKEQVGFVNIFLLVFVGIALFVSIFIISNTFRMIVHSQQQQFAMLRAIGASRRHIFAIVTAQGLGIGILGSTIGVGLGAALAQGLRGLLAHYSLELSQIPVKPSVMIITVVVGITVTFLGALLPARAAARIAPVEAMREAQLSGQSVKKRPLIIGSVLMVLGVGCWLYSISDATDRPGTFLALAIVAALIGLLMVTPALTIPVIQLLGLSFAAMKPTGQLAARNVLRNPRRTAATASALTIGVCLVVLGAVMAETMRDATASVVDDQLQTEFVVVSQAGAPINSVELIRDLRAIDGVDSVNDEITGVSLQVQAPGEENFAPQMAISVDPASINRDFIFPFVEGNLDAFIHPVDDRIPVLVAKFTAREQNISPGDTLRIKGEKAEREAVVAAIIESMVLKRPYSIPADAASELGAPTVVKNTILISATPGADLEQVQADITAVTDRYENLLAMSKDEYKGQIAQMVNIMLGIVYALLALSMIIAVFGIINTQSLSIGERIREIGLLRAIGLSRTKIASMVVMESILTALLGTLLGFAAGTAVSWALIDYLIRADLGFTRFVFPTNIVGITIVAAVLIGSLAGIVPAIRAARIRLLTAISTE